MKLVEEFERRATLPFQLMFEGIAAIVGGGALMYFEGVMFHEILLNIPHLIKTIAFGIDLAFMSYGGVLMLLSLLAYTFPSLQKYIPE